MNILKISLFSFILATSQLLWSAPEIGAASAELKSLWNDPALTKKIEAGIEANRKGNFSIKFDKPAENVKLKHIRHEFVFGAPTMMLGCFVDENQKPDEEKTGKIEELLFGKLFNGATLSFLWKYYEPEKGKFRFDEDVDYIRFRPSPAKILKMCKKYGLTTRMHCLVWHSDQWHNPSWIQPDQDSYEKDMCAYIREVGKRFGDKVDYVNVVNESSHLYTPRARDFMPFDYVFKGFKEADKHFPSSAKFCYNELTTAWDEYNEERESAPAYLTTQNLILRGARLDELGLQFHIFSEYDYSNMMKGKRYTPDCFYNALDGYAKLGLPIQITELTFPALPQGEVGEANQAFVAENLYKLFFSHSAVESITWWHTLDGTSKAEGKWMSGILRYDFSKKPAYEVLDKLINKQWRTNLQFDGKQKEISFRGFYGIYEITFSIDGKETKHLINCSKRGAKAFKVSAENAVSIEPMRR